VHALAAVAGRQRHRAFGIGQLTAQARGVVVGRRQDSASWRVRALEDAPILVVAIAVSQPGVQEQIPDEELLGPVDLRLEVCRQRGDADEGRREAAEDPADGVLRERTGRSFGSLRIVRIVAREQLIAVHELGGRIGEVEDRHAGLVAMARQLGVSARQTDQLRQLRGDLLCPVLARRCSRILEQPPTALGVAPPELLLGAHRLQPFGLVVEDRERRELGRDHRLR